jgi:hypothetical protein
MSGGITAVILKILKYVGSSILTILIIVSTVSEFNIVWKDADGA